MLLAVLAHVDAHHRAFVVEQELRQGFGELGLTHTGGSEEHERARRPVGVGNAGARTPYRIGNGLHRLLLADHTLAQLLLHTEQLGRLTFEHPACRDAGPRLHHFGDVVGSDFLLEHHVLASLGVGQRGVELLLDLGDASVAQLRGLGQVTVALSPVGLAAQRLQLLLELAHHVDGALLVLPPGGQLGELFLLVGQFRAQLLQAVLRRSVFLLGQRHLLDLEATDQPLDLVDFDGPGIDLHAQPRRRLVDQVDRLVGQEARRDVAVTEGGRCHQCGVGDAHAVVHLVAVLEAAQDADGVLDGGFADEHLLEAALQRGVLFDVLAVLVERRRTHQPQLTAGQHGFDHVARIHRGFPGGTGTDDGVQLVDERDDLPGRILDVVEDGLEALLELTAVLGARHHGTQVERHNGLVPQ